MVYLRRMKYKSLLPHYVRGLTEGLYTLKQASVATGYTVEHLCRLKKKFIAHGYAVFEHAGKGKTPHNRIPEDIRKRVASLYTQPEYEGINFLYFRECLRDYEGIELSYNALRRILTDAGFQSPEAHKRKKAPSVHRRRPRKEHEGEMLQIDGTPFPWFGKFGNTKNYCLMGAIDDATGKLSALYITDFECLYGYMEVLRRTVRRNGIPQSIYSDRSAIFCFSPRDKKNLTQWEQLDGVHTKRTQWQRICDDLNIRQILAWSPEAKGRVERLWGTLQGRLPAEFRRNSCDTVEKANKFLERYVDTFNARFSVKPMKDKTLYRTCFVNLEEVLSAQFPRRVENCGCISFHSYKFQIDKSCRHRDKRCILHVSERGLFVRFDEDSAFYPVHLVDDFVGEGLGETMPHVVADIIYRYMYAYGKEISA